VDARLAQGRPQHILRRLGVAGRLVVLADEALDAAHVLEGFGGDAGRLCHLILHAPSAAPRQPADDQRHDNEYRYAGDNEQRQPPVEQQHDQHAAGDGQHMARQAYQVGGQQTADGGHITGQTADQVADVLLAVEAQRQALQVSVKLAAQVVDHALASDIRVVVARHRSDRDQREQDQHQQNARVQAGHLAGTERRVHHALDERWQRQEYAAGDHARQQRNAQQLLVRAHIPDQAPPLRAGDGRAGYVLLGES